VELMSALRTVAHGGPLSDPLFAPFSIAAALLIVFLPGVLGAQSASPTQWAMGGHDLSDTWNQPFTTIGVSNVSRLTSQWVFTTGGSVSATPAVVTGVVYFPDWAGNF
jgi:polyvinyl alcohol dehydrogenase (cytochrome)